MLNVFQECCNVLRGLKVADLFEEITLINYIGEFNMGYLR